MNGRQATATGFVLFVAIIAIINGVWGFLLGLAAIVKREFFVVTPNYVYEFSAVGWGWIHLILGILVAIVGIALLLGQEWARWAAVVLVILQAIAQFFFIPYYPWWSIIILILDIVIIWALVTYRPERI